jgi:flagellar hook-associated protein 3 FlgL
LAQGNPTGLSIVQADAEALLGNIVGSLNTRIGQRQIFGGQETSVAPLESAAEIQTKIDTIIANAPDTDTALANIEQFFADPAGGFQTSSYRGSEAEGPRLHITDTRSLSSLPKADDPIFRDILKGLTLVASARNAATQEEASALMQAGFEVLDTGSGQLLNLEARLGAGQQNLDVITNNMRAERGFLAAAEQNLLGRDVFEAAAELQALEGQLQASYTVTGRLGALSLANFLR